MMGSPTGELSATLAPILDLAANDLLLTGCKGPLL